MIIMWLLLGLSGLLLAIAYDTLAGKMLLYHYISGADVGSQFFRQPRHGAIVRAVNFIGRLLQTLFGLHFGPLNADKMLAVARKLAETEGVDCRVIDEVEAPLRLFVSAVRSSYAGEGAKDAPRFSTFGCLAAWKEGSNWLANRVRLEKHIKQHPDALLSAEELDGYGPVVILGLPRTGTTLLHLLMSLDPRSRSFAPWEMMQVTPPAERDTYAADPRIEEYRKRFEMSAKLMPGAMGDIHANHISGPTYPEECILLHSNSLHSGIFAMALRDEAYHQFVHFDEAAVSAMMDYHRRQVQVLMHKYKPSPGGHMVLKAPCYSLWIDEVRRVYPNSKIIMTHRDPVGVVPSTAKILHPVNEMFLESCDLAVEARTAERVCSEFISKAIDLRQALDMPFCSRRDLARAGPDSPLHHTQHMDVHIAEMKDNAIGVVEDIYRHFGWGEVLPEHRTRMEDVLQKDAKLKRHPVPSTSGILYHRLDTWGLETAKLEERFADYRNLLAMHFDQ